jgi:hypothetical protein
MLMSPVGPAFAKEDTQHATTPIQHAGKRRIAPFAEMDAFTLAKIAETRAHSSALRTGGYKNEAYATVAPLRTGFKISPCVILSEAKNLLLRPRSRFFGLRPQNDSAF